MTLNDWGTGVTRHGKVTTQWELVTPELAEAYRATMARNRTFNRLAAEQYANDMTTGDWPETHQGIAFGEAGDLVDGQHRLAAVARSGKAQWLLVTRGLSRAAVEAMDRGKRRTLAHALQVIGADLSTGRSVAVARRMMYGPLMPGFNRRAAMTEVAVRKFMERHVQAIVFALGAVSKAHVTAAVGRAYYHHDPEQLVRFCKALADMVPDDDIRPIDKVARLLRDQVNLGGQSNDVLTTLYRKAQNAISSWMAGRQLQRPHSIEEDLFPLPKDSPALAS